MTGHLRIWDTIVAGLLAAVVAVCLVLAVWPDAPAQQFPVPVQGCVTWAANQGIACANPPALAAPATDEPAAE